MATKTLIAICGATASGKTGLAIQLAQYYNTAILSFDSRQCYKELNIGVARPSEEELSAAPHYFIASHAIHDKINAGFYETYALQTLSKLFEQTDLIIAVGGTGLYLNTLCHGVDAIPEIPIELRQELQYKYDEHSLAWLQQEIKKYDNSYTDANDLNNVQRMLRALEVVIHTGKTIKEYHSQPKAERPFVVEKFAIEMNRALLYERINKRVDIMMEQGQLEEVKTLQQYKDLNALQTVGYAELFDYLDGKHDLPKAIELIKQHTRNYAKRQLTWFRRDESICWINNANQIIEKIQS